MGYGCVMNMPQSQGWPLQTYKRWTVLICHILLFFFSRSTSSVIFLAHRAKWKRKIILASDSYDGGRHSWKRLGKQHSPAKLIGILSQGLECYDNIHCYPLEEALILQAFTRSGDLDVDESKVEGAPSWVQRAGGWSSTFWVSIWYLDMLGDVDASTSRVWMQWEGHTETRAKMAVI